MRCFIILLSVVLQTAALGIAQEQSIYARHDLPLRGSVERSLQHAEVILKAMGAQWYEQWETPRCLQARFATTSGESIIVLMCEGMPWEDTISLGCSSFLSPATEQLCEAIQHSYLFDT